MRPNVDVQPLSGATHWQREVDTDNSIYFMARSGGLFSPFYVEVQRFTPDNLDFANPEIVATFNPKKMSMVHSFSVTKNYAVFFYYAMATTGGMCMIRNRFHVMECIEEMENEPTDIYVVNLKTGEVHEISAMTFFAFHHINAYEINNGTEILLDMSPSDPRGLEEYPAFENMLHPPEHSTGTNGSTCGDEEITRYHINLVSKTVEASTFPNLHTGENKRYVNKFDFGTINEAYRGKEVCTVLLNRLNIQT